MKAVSKRDQLAQWVMEASDEKIAALHTLVKDDLTAADVPDEQLQMILEARERHLRGETASIPWEEVYQRLRNQVRNHVA